MIAPPHFSRTFPSRPNKIVFPPLLRVIVEKAQPRGVARAVVDHQRRYRLKVHETGSVVPHGYIMLL